MKTYTLAQLVECTHPYHNGIEVNVIILVSPYVGDFAPYVVASNRRCARLNTKDANACLA